MRARFSKPANGPAQVRRAAVAAVLLAAAISLGAQTQPSAGGFLSPSHRIAALETGIAPELYGSTAVLAYRPPEPARPVRYVALRFQDDATLHVYDRVIRRSPPSRGEGTFTLFVLSLDLSRMSVPPDGRLLYRITVDGLWMTDPENPARVFDPATRLYWSLIEVNLRDVRPPESPVWMPDGTARFRFMGEPGRRVALVGDFNRWDPYVHALAEVAPGEYSIDLRLPPGPHFYVYLVDGVWTPDALNPRRGLDPWGRRICVVSPQPVALR